MVLGCGSVVSAMPWVPSLELGDQGLACSGHPAIPSRPCLGALAGTEQCPRVMYPLPLICGAVTGTRQWGWVPPQVPPSLPSTSLHTTSFFLLAAFSSRKAPAGPPPPWPRHSILTVSPGLLGYPLRPRPTSTSPEQKDMSTPQQDVQPCSKGTWPRCAVGGQPSSPRI